jgi:hypothetical protein
LVWREKGEGDKFGGLGRKGVEGGGDSKVMVGTQSVWQWKRIFGIKVCRLGWSGLGWAGLEIKESPSQLDIIIPSDYLSTRL